MDRLFTRIANAIAGFIGRPQAFVGAALLIIGWAATGPLFAYSDTWQLVVNTTTTIITFLVVFLIQNSQNRDAAAIQAKLDELIRSADTARNQFIGIEHLTDRDFGAIRAALEKETRTTQGDPAAHEAIERLLARI